MKMMTSAIVFLAATAFLTAGTLVQAQQSSTGKTKITDVPQPWAISCNAPNNSAELVCVMSQRILNRQTGRRMIAASIRPAVGGQGRILQLQLPHGIKLTSGVAVKIDGGQAEKHPILWSDNSGTYAEIVLNNNWIAALKRGTLLQVGVSARNDQQINFEISLRGFTGAFERI